jgi:hypothetical protein
MALWENVIGYGLLADRPAAGSPGAVYCTSDTGEVYRDNGLSWDLVAGVPSAQLVPFTIHVPMENYEIPSAHCLVIIGNDDIVITLPSAGTCPGQTVGIVTDGHPFAVHLQDTSDAPQSGLSPALYVSDGARWWTFYGYWA